MELVGKVVQVMDVVSGEGRNGTWRKQSFVIETGGDYPKKACFQLWGNRIDEAAVKVDEQVKVHFDVESREYNERWYTDLKAWRVEKESANTGGQNDSFVDQAPAENAFSDVPPPGEDDLPF